MLYTKFQGYRSIGSGEEDLVVLLFYVHGKHRQEDVLRFLPYMGMAAMLVM